MANRIAPAYGRFRHCMHRNAGIGFQRLNLPTSWHTSSSAIPYLATWLWVKLPFLGAFIERRAYFVERDVHMVPRIAFGYASDTIERVPLAGSFDLWASIKCRTLAGFHAMRDVFSFAYFRHDHGRTFSIVNFVGSAPCWST
jgi:hypothetical protein